MSDFDLGDAWRVRNPDVEQYTFHRGVQASRLDLWVMSNHLIDKCDSMSITPLALSDPSMLTTEIGHRDSPRGPGIWRFDGLLLSDTEFTQQMTDLIRSHIDHKPMDDPILFWDWMKYEIRKFSRTYEKRRRAERRQREDRLNRRFADLVERRDQGEGGLDEDISSLRDSLTELELDRAHSIIFRARCQWSQ